MADFIPAFERMIIREGGYKLTNDPVDKGGQTFAGIARTRNPGWAGWAIVDAGGTPQADLVRGFYRANFWTSARLEEVKDQRIAETIFDFGVNAGTGTAAKLAQVAVGATPDGSIGAKTLALINAAQPELFLAHYTIAKIARYHGIVRRDKTQIRFLSGWIGRALEQAS
jgi:lysozyme family protein